MIAILWLLESFAIGWLIALRLRPQIARTLKTRGFLADSPGLSPLLVLAVLAGLIGLFTSTWITYLGVRATKRCYIEISARFFGSAVQICGF